MASDDRAAWSPWRGGVIFSAAAFFVFFQLILQTFPSVMRDGLVVDLSLTGAGFGGLSSSFYYPYILLQIPAGLLVARFGPRRVLLVSAALCALASFLFSTSTSAWSAETTRILMGFGAGPTVVCAMTLGARWFPPRHFPLLVALTELSAMVGAAIGQEALGFVVERAGWRAGMLACGFVALGILVLIAVLVRDRPPTGWEGTDDGDTAWPDRQAVGRLLRSPTVLLKATAGGMVSSAVVAFGMLWAVPFLEHQRGLPLSHAAFCGSMYFWGCLPGMLGFAWLGAHHFRPARVLAFGAAGTFLLLALILFVPLSFAGLCAAMFFLGAMNSSYTMAFSMVREEAPAQLTGVAMGLTNMLIMGIGGLFLQPLIGVVAGWRGHDTPDAWTLAIILVAQVLALGILFGLRWRRPPAAPRAPHLELGRAGEDLAADHLRRHGHKILYRNFRAPHGGEVDIICRDKAHNELVFVEVKTRSTEEFGRPAVAVDRKKRRLIIRGAMTWLRMLDMPDITFRFDVVEVVMDGPPDVRHIENAFVLPPRYVY